MKYDYLIVGAGAFGATFARTATDLGKRCLLVDRREHIAGNTYSKKIEGIDVHMYGAHIFHTDNEKIWEFVNRFGQWHAFQNNPRVRVGNKIYSFPINLMTFHQLWGVTTPAEAREKIQEVRIPNDNPKNAEEWLLAQVGEEIYETFFRGYTKKQWFKEPRELPASIVTRLPVRLTYNDSYFATKYQAIPRDGYTDVFEKMLEGIDVDLGVDFYAMRDSWKSKAKHLVFTGPIDQYHEYQFGKLEYRSLRFDFEIHDGDYQGHAVVNYPEESVEHLRIIEHKHFTDFGPKHIKAERPTKTVITKDVPLAPEHHQVIDDPQYPIRDERNSSLYDQYAAAAKNDPSVMFGGRLGEYRYYDIDQAMGSAMMKARRHILKGKQPAKRSDSRAA